MIIAMLFRSRASARIICCPAFPGAALFWAAVWSGWSGMADQRPLRPVACAWAWGQLTPPAKRGTSGGGGSTRREFWPRESRHGNRSFAVPFGCSRLATVAHIVVFFPNGAPHALAFHLGAPVTTVLEWETSMRGSRSQRRIMRHTPD